MITKVAYGLNSVALIFCILITWKIFSTQAENEFLRSLQRAKKQKINLIGIGTPENMRKHFAFTVDYTDTKKSVKKFIDSYSVLVQSQ